MRQGADSAQYQITIKPDKEHDVSEPDALKFTKVTLSGTAGDAVADAESPAETQAENPELPSDAPAGKRKRTATHSRENNRQRAFLQMKRTPLRHHRKIRKLFRRKVFRKKALRQRIVRQRLRKRRKLKAAVRMCS